MKRRGSSGALFRLWERLPELFENTVLFWVMGFEADPFFRGVKTSVSDIVWLAAFL